MQGANKHANSSPTTKLSSIIACTAPAAVLLLMFTLHNSTAGGQRQQDRQESTLRYRSDCSFVDKVNNVDCGFTE